MRKILASALASLALFAFAANAQEVEQQTETETTTTTQQPAAGQQPAAQPLGADQQQMDRQQLGADQQQLGASQDFGFQQSAFGQQHGDLQQSVGTISGAVSSLDYNKGTITLDTGAGRMTLHARPLDIAALNPGDVISVPYGNYDGRLWVTPSDMGQDMSSFAVNGIVTGTVSAVDKTNGLFSIRGQTFRAHPEDVESLIPGQFVQVDYARIAGVDWAANVSASSGGQQGQGLRKAGMNR